MPLAHLFFGLTGEKTFVDQLVRTFSEVLNGGAGSGSPLDSVHSAWRQIVQDLGVQSRLDTPFKSTIYFKGYDDILGMFGLDQTTLDGLKTKIRDVLVNPALITNAVCGKTPFHVTKVMLLNN